MGREMADRSPRPILAQQGCTHLLPIRHRIGGGGPCGSGDDEACGINGDASCGAAISYEGIGVVITVAARIDRAVRRGTGGPLPVRIRAWDASEAGPIGGPVAVLRGRRAIRRLVYSPGELGLADAYISGDLDVEGDLSTALGTVWNTARDGQWHRVRPGPLGWLRLAATAVRLGAVGPRPRRPGAPARLAGRRHSRRRDREVIARHYDVPPEFYRLLLDHSMAYSCGYFASGATGGLADAQYAKLDLICRKVGLEPGSTLLDVGCGWGSLACHAARHHGVRVTAVTLSARQAEYVKARCVAEGVSDAVTVRLADYRDLDGDGAFDAVAAVEMGEHVGEREYPRFADLLYRSLRPGGRALVQQMSRTGAVRDGGPFIRTWIAPDMHMKPLSETIGALASGGLEVRDVQAMREHYAWTIRAWAENLETHWEQAVSMVGLEVARVWRLYLTGSALTFAGNRMGVDQILAIRPGPEGDSGMPAARTW